MSYHLKSLASGAFALALLGTAAGSAGPAAASSGDLAGETVGRGSEPASVLVAADHGDSGRDIRRVLGELTSEGEPPAGFDLRRVPRGSEGGTSAGPGGGPSSYSAGPWCNAQCITKGVAYLHGSGVEIVVNTSVPAQLYVSVVQDTDGDGNFGGDDDFDDATTSQGHVTELSWIIPDLEPGATYYAMAAATDVYGNTSYAWGSFTMPS